MKGICATRLTGRHQVALLSGALISLLPALALAAADAETEIRTAAEHAQFAMQAKEVRQIHLHLHHVINCLEGNNGPDFDASAGNPCKGEGHGALKDVGNVKKEAATLSQAVKVAKTGLRDESYDKAHTAARTVHGLLTQADRASR
jgi:hypothetical protein